MEDIFSLQSICTSPEPDCVEVAAWLILIIIWCVIFPPITKVNKKYKTKQVVNFQANDWCFVLIVFLNFSSQMEFQESWLGWWDAGGEKTEGMLSAQSKSHYKVTCPGADLIASTFHLKEFLPIFKFGNFPLNFLLISTSVIPFSLPASLTSYLIGMHVCLSY